jgi:hypothetical protein
VHRRTFTLEPIAPASLAAPDLRAAYFAAGGRGIAASCYRITVTPPDGTIAPGCAQAVVAGDRIGLAWQGQRRADWCKHGGDVEGAVRAWLREHGVEPGG